MQIYAGLPLLFVMISGRNIGAFDEFVVCRRNIADFADGVTNRMDTFGLLESSISAAALRQQVYANNIANVNTPNYKRQDVAFETLFQNALNAPQAVPGEQHIPISNTTGTSSLPNVQPVVYTDYSTSVDNNGNNVDLTSEMSALAENQLKYETLVQDVTQRIQRVRAAITGS